MRRRRLTAAASALLVLAALGGCAAPKEIAAEGEDGRISIDYVQSTDSLAYVPIYIAINMGYFEEEGVDFNRVPNAGTSAQTAQAVVTGQGQVAATGSTGVYGVVAQERDVTSIATIVKKSLLELTLGKAAVDRLRAKGITPESPVEDRVRALRGLTIGAQPEGSFARVQLEATLREFGLAASDVRLVAISEPNALVPAMREGQIDGFAFSLPTTRVPVVDGEGSLWVSYPRGDVPSVSDTYYIDLLTSRLALDANREPLLRFLRAVWRAYDLLENDPEAAKAAVRKSFPDLGDELFDVSYGATAAALTGGMVPEQEPFERTAALWESSLDKPANLTFDDVYSPELVRESEPR
ncbi:ABC transporter substrate-binding protein [Actinophytocola sp.]|uniref:ABC transporter substrate-binding protein n=1 Tax=Actinophytocola sp. TaxID=1872138 RepID=UPI003D6A60AC